MKKSILLIAFDFPPCTSPGVERTLRFAEHLQNLGWSPIVLTVNTSTFNIKNFDDSQFQFPVYRTFCLDVSRHLSFKGKYLGWMKQPDRYWGWLFTALFKAVNIVKKHDISLIWSTYPILTSHMIALSLCRLTRLPWVADYRDPLQCHYDEAVYSSFKFHRWLDRQTIKFAQQVTFTSPSAQSRYTELYRDICHGQFSTIENGFEESLFNKHHKINEIKPVETKHTMAHLGSLYANGRDPKVFFESLEQLKSTGVIDEASFELILVGVNNQTIYEDYAEALGINDLIRFYPQVSHAESLSLLLNVDSLLIVQGEIFSAQIPSKAYEYLATNKPVLAFTNKNSDTDVLLNTYKGCFIAESQSEVSDCLVKIIANKELFFRAVESFSRKGRAKQLAKIFDGLLMKKS